jgi:hypothetical protein
MDSDHREKARRASDDLRYWVPLVLSLVSTILALGIVYGSLGGRLNLIEYRLQQIERFVNIKER